jgi:hypothetical protein
MKLPLRCGSPDSEWVLPAGRDGSGERVRRVLFRLRGNIHPRPADQDVGHEQPELEPEGAQVFATGCKYAGGPLDMRVLNGVAFGA